MELIELFSNLLSKFSKILAISFVKSHLKSFQTQEAIMLHIFGEKISYTGISALFVGHADFISGFNGGCGQNCYFTMYDENKSQLTHSHVIHK